MNKFCSKLTPSLRVVSLAGFVLLLGSESLLQSAVPPPYVWAKAFGGASMDKGTATAVDAGGNVYVTGAFSGSMTIGTQSMSCPNPDGCLFLVKLDPNGNPLWASSFGNSFGIGKAVAVDAGGNVIFGGVSVSANFGCGSVSGSIFAAKLAPNGSCLWSKGFRSGPTGGTSYSGGSDTINGLALDASGNVFAAGQFGCSTSLGCGIDFGGGVLSSSQTPSYGGVFLTKLSATNGGYLWAKAFGGASGQDYATGVAIDAFGNAFITGSTCSSILNLGGLNLPLFGCSDVFVAKYLGSNGAHSWSKRVGGVSNEYSNAIAIDSSGAAIITGQFQGLADFGGVLLSGNNSYPSIFLARYASADGATLWAKAFGNSVSNVGRALAADGSGHVVVTGYFMGTLDFGGGVFVTGPGSLDVFLAQYNIADGSTAWARGMGGAFSDLGSGLDIDANGNIVIAGHFQGPADFGGGSVPGVASYDMFVAKYGAASVTAPPPTTTTLASSLNPSTSGQYVTFTAAVSPSGATGTVTFMDGGTTLGTGTLSGGVATYSTSILAAGSHSMTAAYSGNANYSASTSNPVVQTVNTTAKINTTSYVSSSLNPSTSGQYVSFTATVSPSAATGTVTFMDGAATLGTGTLSGGVATYSTSILAAGSHSITAAYGGNASYGASTSNPLIQTVNTTAKINTTSSVSSSLNPSTSGQYVSFTATVSPSAATGTVTFMDGATAIGSASLVSGRAVYSTSTLSSGYHSITANYSGNASYNGSVSGVLTQTVNSTGDFSIAVSGGDMVKIGTTASYTVTVTGMSGFASAVTFSLSSSPGGVPATFSPSTVTGSGSTTMSIPTDVLMKNATYTLTVTGTGGGKVHTVQTTLKVHN